MYSQRDIDEAEYLSLLAAEDYALSEQTLSHFVRAAWPILEPGTPFIDGWHVDLVGEYLDALRLGQIPKLIINMRFRSIKSIAATVCFPVHWWITDPSRRFLCGSHSDSLAVEHNVSRRDLIKSDWFQAAWGSRFKLDLDDRKQSFINDKRGSMKTTSVGGSVVGKGGDCLIIDDPNDPKNLSDVAIFNANNWYDKTFSNRKNQEKSSELLVMQRVASNDLTAHVLEQGGWTQLVVPWEAEKKTIIVFPISKREHVREVGDIMDPERFSIAMKPQWQKTLGPLAYPAQVQQSPKPVGGGMLKRTYWKRYAALPKDIIRVRQYWDCAEVPGVSNDYSVCATIAETPTGFYWLDVGREQVEWDDLEQAAKDLYAKWNGELRSENLPTVEKVKIEFKSAGIQLFQHLSRKSTLPVEKFLPGQRDKQVRAAGALPTIAAGNCYLPDSDTQLTWPVEWVEDFVKEHEDFPGGDHDDRVDTTSMAVEDFRYGDDEPRAWG